MSKSSSEPEVKSWLCCLLTPELICTLCGLKVCDQHSTVEGFEEVYDETGPCPKALELQGHMWKYTDFKGIAIGPI